MSGAAPKRRSLVAYLPLILFAGLVAVFLVRLFSGDPSKLPSALLGKPVPVFTLPAIEGSGQPGFSNVDLGHGRVSVINVFASWCAPCHQEHPLLMELAKDTRIVMVGINQKDKAENARRVPGRLGNPYARVGADNAGPVSVEWRLWRAGDLRRHRRRPDRLQARRPAYRRTRSATG